MEKNKMEETVDEIKEVISMAADELKNKVVEIVEENEQDEDVNNDVVEADIQEGDESSDPILDEEEIHQIQEDTKRKSNRKLHKAAKYVVAAGVGATIVTAGVLFRKNTVKTAYRIAREFV